MQHRCDVGGGGDHHFGDEDESHAVPMISCGVLKEPDIFEAVAMDLGCIQVLYNQMMTIVTNNNQND